MELIKTRLEGVLIIKSTLYKDERGSFSELYSQREFEEKVCKTVFVQDNESRSRYGVLRGLHFQRAPYAQAKLVRVVCGKVLDVVVDLRHDSPTYGDHLSVMLSDEDNIALFLPRGFAHGYLVLSKEAIFQYKCDNYYAPEYEDGIIWNDPTLNIDWTLSEEEIILSEKDRRNPLFMADKSKK